MSLENDSFLKIADTITNTYLEKSERKIAGFYCTYIPEEILDAGGFFPYRIRATGNEDTELADTYMVRFTCSFVRSTLNLALMGEYDFLDGLFICNSCDHSRRMFEIFDLVVFKRENFTKEVPRFYISLPHIISEEGFQWFYQELKELKENIENAYNLSITEDALNISIDLYNKNRRLMRKIYDLRALDEPKINGTDALRMAMANSSVPKEVANPELERILKSITNSPGIDTTNRKRILLLGSVVDNIQFTKLVEDSGAIIISDNLCFGNRTIVDDIDEDKSVDPLARIALRLYYRLSCPRMMDDHPRRLEFIKKEIEKGKIDGVILQRINNCDLHGCDNMLFEHELKDLEIPVFNIDRESFQSDATRLQTRIEAFLEMIM
ncbi:MAG: 2-hydroxyglutaryl-CoA dehydratase, D-component [Promethearchaeota archaeon]|nr:MAG: 2-hydroxyglutaryl-CoA dehydratase, D-component [Candidatus Lokiarchaeota archaeon]